jgi:hypothetical protein
LSGACGAGGVFSIRRRTSSSRLDAELAMADPQLPDALLIAIGKFATCWTKIEQELLLSASALATQETDGEPIEHLRLDFRRLRERWFELASARINDNRLTPINMELAAASKVRGYILHGLWHEEAPGQFVVHWYEQKGGKGLQECELRTSTDVVAALAVGLERLHDELRIFVSGE